MQRRPSFGYGTNRKIPKVAEAPRRYICPAPSNTHTAIVEATNPKLAPADFDIIHEQPQITRLMDFVLAREQVGDSGSEGLFDSPDATFDRGEIVAGAGRRGGCCEPGEAAQPGR